MQLKIYQKTTNDKIIIFSYYLIKNFCKIFKLNLTGHKSKRKLHKFSLLKSPHIHKKTWRRYTLISYTSNLIINNLNINTYNKLLILCNILSKNSTIKLKSL